MYGWKSQRTKKESRLLEKASKLIPVPKIKVSSLYEIEMEFINGKKLSEHLESLDYKKICNQIGKQIAILHDNDVIHGDLTTSNMILRDKKIYFVDFHCDFGYQT